MKKIYNDSQQSNNVSFENNNQGVFNQLSDASRSFKIEKYFPSIGEVLYSRDAKATAEKLATISIDDFLNQSAFYPINNLVCLSIDNLDELQKFQNSLLTQRILNFCDKIQEINLCSIYINNEDTLNLVIKLFNTIAQNIKFFSNFSELDLGKINESISLHFLEPFGNLKNLTIDTIETRSNVKLALPMSITHLEVSVVGQHSSLTLVNSLSNLTSLKISIIYKNATISLPNTLHHLTTFKINRLHEYVVFHLPNLSNNLNLNIGTYWNFLPGLPPFETNFVNNCVTFSLDFFGPLSRKYLAYNPILQVLHLLPNLKSLILQDIPSGGKIKLPDTFDSLETLVIGKIGIQAIVELSVLPNLKNLSIGQIEEDAILKFPIALNGLENLLLGEIDTKGILQLKFDTRTYFTINPFNRDTRVPVSLNNLTNLYIENSNTLTPELFALCSNLESLSIEYIDKNCMIKFPDTLINLKKLSIGKICEGAVLNISNSLKNLTNLSIEEIGDDVELILPNWLKNSKSSIVGTAYRRILGKTSNKFETDITIRPFSLQSQLTMFYSRFSSICGVLLFLTLIAWVAFYQ